MTQDRTSAAEQDVRNWLERVVIGLNLCPFAKRPFREGRVRIVATAAREPADLLAVLRTELSCLTATPRGELETTLVVLTDSLQDFFDYNQFLDEVDLLIRSGGWEGDIQAASFHPEYCFADTKPDDPANLTNRSPWPVIHLLREESVSEGVEQHPDAEGIPQRNIARLRDLSAGEVRELFPWLEWGT